MSTEVRGGVYLLASHNIGKAVLPRSKLELVVVTLADRPGVLCQYEVQIKAAVPIPRQALMDSTQREGERMCNARTAWKCLGRSWNLVKGQGAKMQM